MIEQKKIKSFLFKYKKHVFIKKNNRNIKSNQKKIPNLTASLFCFIKNKPNNTNNTQFRLTAKLPSTKDKGKV